MTLTEAIVKTGDVIRQLQQCTGMHDVGIETRDQIQRLEQQLRVLIDREFSRRLHQSARESRVSRRQASVG
jgi:hypothetical protein